MSLLDGLFHQNRFLYSIVPRAWHPSRHDRDLVESIRNRAADLGQIPDAQLPEHIDALRQAICDGTPPESLEILVPAAALTTVAIERVLGIRYYDVQLIAGLALIHNAIAEMQTGEGKTFVAALPAVFRALSGCGVHVMTVNDYLAERDSNLLSDVYKLLGLSVGLLQSQSPLEEKQAAYHCDITYGTGYEFGFDYLRDQLDLSQFHKRGLGSTYRQTLRDGHHRAVPIRQRGQAFAIVDELDSVLIDEATTPLVISIFGSDDIGRPVFHEARNLADRLELDVDYKIRSNPHQVRLTHAGVDRCYKAIPQYTRGELIRPWTQYVEQALTAKWLLFRDVDYVVDGQEVKIVDQSTGRILPGRTWQDGLHQAVETAEGIKAARENTTLARISRQRYSRLYEGLCGMTGTASGCEREFWTFYRLPVVTIPRNVPGRRLVLPTRFFADAASKWDALVDEIEQVHDTRRPVLVGTRTIEDSETVAQKLRDHGLAFQLLNGRQDAEEASVVAQAGQADTVTIATNMAGRGTDIKLGQGVDELGGLHVIGAEPHESERIDRQLAGRAARQGDSGSCRFYVSVEDLLIQRHAPWLAKRIERLAGPNGTTSTTLSNEIRGVQSHVEALGFAQRKALLAQNDLRNEFIERIAR